MFAWFELESFFRLGTPLTPRPLGPRTQRPSRSGSDSDLLHTEVAGQKDELLVGNCIRNRDKIQMMAGCSSSLGQISISQKKKIQKEEKEERVTLCLVR